MEIKIEEMSKPAKIASTKALTDLGYSIRQIAKIMGIDEKTVLRYQRKELSKEWDQFATTIKKIWMEQDFELSQLAYQEMKKKIPKARFFELVGLYKTVRELQQQHMPSNIIGIKGDDIKVEFIKYDPNSTSS